ncbi:hypothetical protein SDC9_124322 [bioreactor metagenome]|uniref:Uncharacterized protein n=1 Tax=bioreactor metagenome TaxID=1076179 RepID=A0A645CK54_9ZZZZ
MVVGTIMRLLKFYARQFMQYGACFAVFQGKHWDAGVADDRFMKAARRRDPIGLVSITLSRKEASPC